MAREIFKEQHRYRKWEIFLFLIALTTGLTYFFVYQNYFIEVEPMPMPLSIYLSLVLPLVGILIYTLRLTLSVRVTEKHISLRYSPGNLKNKIKWEDVAECKIHPTPQSTSWQRWSLHKDVGKTYSFSGKTSVHLKTKKGESIFIETKRFKEFENAVKLATQPDIKPSVLENRVGNENF